MPIFTFRFIVVDNIINTRTICMCIHQVLLPWEEA